MARFTVVQEEEGGIPDCPVVFLNGHEGRKYFFERVEAITGAKVRAYGQAVNALEEYGGDKTVRIWGTVRRFGFTRKA